MCNLMRLLAASRSHRLQVRSKLVRGRRNLLRTHLEHVSEVASCPEQLQHRGKLRSCFILLLPQHQQPCCAAHATVQCGHIDPCSAVRMLR